MKPVSSPYFHIITIKVHILHAFLWLSLLLAAFFGLSMVSFIIKVQIVPGCSRTLACLLSLNPLHLKSVDSSHTSISSVPFYWSNSLWKALKYA